MARKCFVIMPASDPIGYPKGHVERVYQYIVIPACRMAGFSPVRSDEPGTTAPGWDIVRDIIESDIAICDLSSKNGNVIYGFVVRQAMNLPVIIMKDLKTQILFNIQEFEMVEYDDSLRIDTVQKEIETVSEALTKTYENRVVINTLLNRFDIGASVAETQPVLIEPDPVNQEESKKEEQLPVISPLPDYAGDTITRPEEIDKLKPGHFIFHKNYGRGEIKSINKMGKDKMAKIEFESGTKVLMLGTSGSFRKVIE